MKLKKSIKKTKQIANWIKKSNKTIYLYFNKEKKKVH